MGAHVWLDGLAADLGVIVCSSFNGRFHDGGVRRLITGVMSSLGSGGLGVVKFWGFGRLRWRIFVPPALG